MREADEASLFSLFSVTKAIVSAASWILLQEGKLGLGDRVADWIPGFGSDGKDVITVEQLLTHTAGMPKAGMECRHWPDPAERVRRFDSWRLEWEPGTRFVYHGQATMWLLAEVISRCSGIDYRDFIRERILEPLGLDRLLIGVPDSLADQVADVVSVGRRCRARSERCRPSTPR